MEEEEESRECDDRATIVYAVCCFVGRFSVRVTAEENGTSRERNKGTGNRNRVEGANRVLARVYASAT